MIVAALDVGTNTSDLVIIENGVEKRVESEFASSEFQIVLEEERFIKLGEGVDENNTLLDSAMERALEVIRVQVGIARDFGAEEIRIAATSASRDAKNAEEFANKVRKEVDLDYNVISGRQEATYTFNGAVSCMKALPSEVLVFDIGGGSTEFCWGKGKIDGSVDQTSLQIGAIRLSEKYFEQLPPTPEHREASREFVDTALHPWVKQLAMQESLIGSAGSTPAKLASLIESETPSLEPSLAEEVPNISADLSIDYETVCKWESKVSVMDENDILEIQGGALRGREKYFLSGIIILESIMRKLSFENFLVSKGGVALGVALAKDWR